MRFTTVCLLALVCCSCSTLDRAIQLQAQEVKEKKEEKKRGYEPGEMIGDWEVQISGVLYDKQSVAVYLYLVNKSESPQRLPVFVQDKDYIERKKPQDPKHKASACVLNDEFGEAYKSYAYGNIKAKDKAINSNESDGIMIVFPRPKLASKYKVTVPGSLFGVKQSHSFDFTSKIISFVDSK